MEKSDLEIQFHEAVASTLRAMAGGTEHEVVFVGDNTFIGNDKVRLPKINDIQSDSSWRSIEDVKEDTLPRCLSTGFLISDDEDMIRLVSDFNFKEDGSIDECGNSTIIPKCVVQEIKEI